MNPRAYVFYHYMPPDNVVSAVHFGDLCSGLAARGWSVSAFPCIRGCREDSQRFVSLEEWNGVSIHRVYRPRFRQSSGAGRLLNAFWMITAWSLLALHPGAEPEVVIVGTDPVLSVLVALFWGLVRPKTKIVHWCFDLYPEAAVADGMMAENKLGLKLLRLLLRSAYRKCSLLADLGPCMRDLLQTYSSSARRETLVPWALIEPAKPLKIDLDERNMLFGQAQLALLYSGTIGRAHSYKEILDLADQLQDDGGKLVFSVRGNCETELKTEARKRRAKISFVDFAQQDRLQARLGCADVHVVSLRQKWTGMVVPSKFFGAISAGRPVLFLGSPQSSIARWIQQFEIGWVLTSANVTQVASALRDYTRSPEQQKSMQERCWSVYSLHFAKKVQIDRWDALLRDLGNDLSVNSTKNQQEGNSPVPLCACPPIHRRGDFTG